VPVTAIVRKRAKGVELMGSGFDHPDDSADSMRASSNGDTEAVTWWRRRFCTLVASSTCAAWLRLR